MKAGNFAKIDVNGNVVESGPMDTPKVLAKYDELVHFNTDGAVKEN